MSLRTMIRRGGIGLAVLVAALYTVPTASAEPTYPTVSGTTHYAGSTYTVTVDVNPYWGVGGIVKFEDNGILIGTAIHEPDIREVSIQWTPKTPGQHGLMAYEETGHGGAAYRSWGPNYIQVSPACPAPPPPTAGTYPRVSSTAVYAGTAYKITVDVNPNWGVSGIVSFEDNGILIGTAIHEPDIREVSIQWTPKPPGQHGLMAYEETGHGGAAYRSWGPNYIEVGQACPA
ncbi:hypothetical protein [Nocardia sp. XZ_19_369]|uniref:hypothetical protein n=1 Tax=Nocardia sp. XZ_19_369 TaxID=2769487 RepID=UPI0018908136|nr:hypothetical protein [Nocardia sp. XZ_19_369]